MKYKTCMMKWFFPVLFVLAIGLTGCVKSKPYEHVQRIDPAGWSRYDILKFEIPVEKTGVPFDVCLTVIFDQSFEHENLNFNMVMNTPSGEERINEYEMRVRTKTGSFLLPCSQDSCSGIQMLKKGLSFSRTGKLVIEIENLTPRLRTEGIRSVGIRLSPSAQ
jgi:gliding motility-associated lipoprotein GldH